MRQIRNPRYCPESLERKLSPSDLVGNLVVDVTTVSVGTCSPLDGGSGTSPNDPPPGQGPPPPTNPNDPSTGPGGPA
jgi:hypothetical protein